MRARFMTQHPARLLLVLALVAASATAVGAGRGAAPVWGYRVVRAYPHDPVAFTEGLAYAADVLYEGTGLEGRSELRRVDLGTGAVLQSRALAGDQFGEGITVLGDRIYQLTWRNRTAFVYDRDTFALLQTVAYPVEGWGVAADGGRLITSDGTSTLVVRDPATFAEVGRIAVRDGGAPVEGLNELEAVGGEVWANVWMTDRIARIDPATGRVTAWIELAGLLPATARPARADAVLNGIAHDPATGRLFVTGKLWPTLFEIEPVPPPGRRGR